MCVHKLTQLRLRHSASPNHSRSSRERFPFLARARHANTLTAQGVRVSCAQTWGPRGKAGAHTGWLHFLHSLAAWLRASSAGNIPRKKNSGAVLRAHASGKASANRDYESGDPEEVLDLAECTRDMMQRGACVRM